MGTALENHIDAIHLGTTDIGKDKKDGSIGVKISVDKKYCTPDVFGKMKTILENKAETFEDKHYTARNESDAKRFEHTIVYVPKPKPRR